MGKWTNYNSQANLGEYAMKSVSVNKVFEVEGLQELSKKMDAMLSKNQAMEKKIKSIINRALNKAEKNMEKYVGSNVFKSDPRHAAKAIRHTVYRRVLGGNINILPKKKRGGSTSYTPIRTLQSGQRGGNRRPRSERTARLEGYEGDDRAFILNFLNSGARVGGGARQLTRFSNDPHRGKVKRGSQGGNIHKYGKTVNAGSRGRIAARNWFGNISMASMREVVAIIETEVDKAIAEEFGKW